MQQQLGMRGAPYCGTGPGWVGLSLGKPRASRPTCSATPAKDMQGTAGVHGSAAADCVRPRGVPKDGRSVWHGTQQDCHVAYG